MNKIKQYMNYTIVAAISLALYILIFDDVVYTLSNNFNLYWSFDWGGIYPLVFLGHSLFPIFCVWVFSHINDRRFSLNNKDIWFLFLCYSVVLLSLLIKPVHSRSYNASLSGFTLVLRNVMRLRPMDLGNIIFFIPLALFQCHWTPNSNFIKRFVGFIIIACTIEVMQYIFMVGVFDVHDIILYIIGFLIGHSLYQISNLVFSIKNNLQTKKKSNMVVNR